MVTLNVLVEAGEVQPPVRVDDWPNPPRPYKTIILHTDNFVGQITIQASIVDNPTETDWINAFVETFNVPQSTEEKSRNRVINSRDRFVYMRAIIDQQYGRVDRIAVL